jgi:hypothetical protein
MLLALILVQNWVYYNDFSIVVIFLVRAFLGVGRCPVATGISDNLESRCSSTYDNKRQVSQKLDRQRVSSLGHSQHIIDQRFLFLKGGVLLLGAFSLD